MAKFANRLSKRLVYFLTIEKVAFPILEPAPFFPLQRTLEGLSFIAIWLTVNVTVPDFFLYDGESEIAYVRDESLFPRCR